MRSETIPNTNLTELIQSSLIFFVRRPLVLLLFLVPECSIFEAGAGVSGIGVSAAQPAAANVPDSTPILSVTMNEKLGCSSVKMPN